MVRLDDGGAGAIRDKARAKVNLGLQVLDRRPDGFHNLETTFARIALHDSVVVAPIETGIDLVVHGDAGGADGAKNLAYRAAKLLGDTVGRSDGVRIELTKRIPTGAGLGGGSADAATTLRLVNTLWGSPLSREALVDLSATLGSDVPFFTSGYAAARGRGRGEILQEVELPEGRALLLALPDVHVNTAQAYGSLDEYRVEHGWSRAGETHSLSGSEGVERMTTNDFEAPVHAMFPELGALYRSLSAVGALSARMSGSGAAHFALFDDSARAEAALPTLQAAHPTVRFLVTAFE